MLLSHYSSTTFHTHPTGTYLIVAAAVGPRLEPKIGLPLQKEGNAERNCWAENDRSPSARDLPLDSYHQRCVKTKLRCSINATIKATPPPSQRPSHPATRLHPLQTNRYYSNANERHLRGAADDKQWCITVVKGTDANVERVSTR